MKKTTEAIIAGIIIPGLGHIHLGFKRRGQIIILSVFALVAISFVLNQSTRSLVSVIWFAGIAFQAVILYDLLRIIKSSPEYSKEGVRVHVVQGVFAAYVIGLFFILLLLSR